jgi:hypothetical protein
MVEDKYSSERPACGPSRRENDNGSNQKGRHFATQQKPENAGEVGVEVRLPDCQEEADWRFQKGSAQSDGRLPVCNEVPSCSCEGPFLRRIAHGSTLDHRHIEVPFHDADPFRVTLAVAGQSAEPDGVALEP